MIRVGLCDDEASSLEKLNRFVEDCYARARVFARVEAFGRGRDLLYEIEDGGRFDILVLDIEMPRMDGMELAARAREALPQVLVTDSADSAGKPVCHKVRKTLPQVYGELDEREFLFIDRGCIVNLAQVMSVDADSCVLRDGTRLPVSRARIQGLRERLLEFWKRHM